jgi:hypothetical protein
VGEVRPEMTETDEAVAHGHSGRSTEGCSFEYEADVAAIATTAELIVRRQPASSESKRVLSD